MVPKEICGLLTSNSYLQLPRDEAEKGGYFFAIERFGAEIKFIINISSIGDTNPVEVYGEVMNLENSIIFDAKKGDFYAYQIRGKVASEQLRQIKAHFTEQINSY